MKTPEEIKEWSKEVHNKARIIGASAKTEEVEEFAYSVFGYAANSKVYIQQLESELEAVKRERDAALRDFKNFAECKNNICHYCVATEAMCDDCGWKYPELFIWRGACPENTEVQDEN